MNHRKATWRLGHVREKIPTGRAAGFLPPRDQLAFTGLAQRVRGDRAMWYRLMNRHAPVDESLADDVTAMLARLS
ncbi:hypothetical protein AB0C33_13400 [Nonomuraea sp. NPDC048881]|uniref:hypothetical protein n=1 Tax=Nonomuraea sp. NPDC048881 TaxID=3155030 RepID=UPI0033C6ACC0